MRCSIAHIAIICRRQGGNFVMQLKLDQAAAEAEATAAVADAELQTVPSGDATANGGARSGENGAQAVADVPVAADSQQKAVEDDLKKDGVSTVPEANSEAGDEPLEG